MINWIKQVLGITQPEPVKEPTQEVPHFHIDRHPVEKQETPDFSNMSKLEIDIWARNELGINLDRQRTKDYMIKQIKTHLEKEN
jgi:hypothetical protein